MIFEACLALLKRGICLQRGLKSQNCITTLVQQPHLSNRIYGLEIDCVTKGTARYPSRIFLNFLKMLRLHLFVFTSPLSLGLRI